MGGSSSSTTSPVAPCCHDGDHNGCKGRAPTKFLRQVRRNSKSKIVLPPDVKPRTSFHDSLTAQDALNFLKAGNARYVASMRSSAHRAQSKELRTALAVDGQNPAAVVIGCADSRCPVETLFDADPGDLFVLRNAGNTCVGAENAIIGSVEYAVGHLGTKLVVVLGHTKCGAIAGATKVAMSKAASQAAPDQQPKAESSMLEALLGGLTPVALQAQAALPICATTEEIAAYAVRLNIFNTMELILKYSESISEQARRGSVQLQGGIYDIETGQVVFVGPPKSLSLSDEHPGGR